MWALLVLSLVEAFKEEQKLVIMDDVNFMEVLHEFGQVFVMLYNPNCGHSRKALPEFIKAAEKLEDQLKFGLINIQTNTHVPTAYSVKGDPTFLLFSDNQHLEYLGQRTSASFQEWILQKTNPKVKVLNSYPALQQFLSNQPRAFVLFASDDSPEAKELTQAVKFYDPDMFGISTNPFALKMYEAKEPSLVVFKNTDDRRKELKLELNRKNILDFVNDEKDTWVMDFNQRALEFFFEEENPVLFLFREETQKTSFDWILQEEASTHNKELSFCKLDLNLHSRFAQLIGMKPLHQPFAMIVETKQNVLTKYLLENITKESVEDFILNWKENKLSPYYKFTNHTLVSEFQEVLKNPLQNLLVHFKADWCEHCKKLEEELNTLSKRLANRKDFYITSIDAMENDIPGEFISEFPTLVFYPKHNRERILYSGAKSEEEIFEFLMKNTPDTFAKEDL